MWQWNRLPGEVVDALVLGVFKVKLDGALNNLVEWEMSLQQQGQQLELDDLQGSFQSKTFCDSMICLQDQESFHKTVKGGNNKLFAVVAYF